MSSVFAGHFCAAGLREQNRNAEKDTAANILSKIAGDGRHALKIADSTTLISSVFLGKRRLLHGTLVANKRVTLIRQAYIGLFLVMGLCSHCTHNNEKANIRDSYNALKINDSTRICFKSMGRDSSLYNPVIVTAISEDTITGFDATLKFAGQCEVSPRRNYVVLGVLDCGYVYTSETDSFYHERASCIVIDVVNHKVVSSMQADCDGQWNADNQWVDATGKLVFDGS